MDVYAESILQLYRAARELQTTDFQAYAMQLMQSRLRFESGVWTTGYRPEPVTRSEARAPTVPILPLSYTLNIDPDAVAEWKQINHADKSIPLVFGNPFVAHRIHTPELFARDDESIMRDYTRRHGKQNALVVALSPRGSTLIEWISIYRAEADDHFAVKEQRFCGTLAVHFSEALKINRLLNDRSRHSLPIPDGTNDPIALMDSSGKMLCASEAFMQACTMQWRDFRYSWFPRAVLQRLLSSAGTEVHAGRLALRARPLTEFWLVTVAAVRSPAVLPHRRLAVARLFAQGHSYKAIARQLELSPSTVRNQIAASYRGLRVSSRDELKRVLDAHRASAP